MIQYILWIIIAFIIGLLSKNWLTSTLKKSINKFKIVKQYWIFSVLFIIANLVVFYAIYKYSPANVLSQNLSSAEHFSTIIFAIFVGYYAFLQVAEGKVDKYIQIGTTLIKLGLYKRAKNYFEKAFILDPKNDNILPNLLELYLIMGEYSSFYEKLDYFKKNMQVEEHDKIIYFYLKIACSLFREELGNAKKDLNLLLKANICNKRMYWNFDDILKSDVFKNLSGETKKIFVNFINYLTNGLDKEKRLSFENGNYADNLSLISSSSLSANFQKPTSGS